jgi:hypothetical protein
LYEPKQKYGGGIRTKKITVRESATGDYFETTYDYTNKVTGSSSGMTASEPLNFAGVAPFDESLGKDDCSSPYLHVCLGYNQYSYISKGAQAKNLLTGFYNLLGYNYFEPGVIYEYVTQKTFGNGSPSPSYSETRYQVFSDDMLQLEILNNVGGLYEVGARTAKLIKKTSAVGNLLHHKIYDLDNKILSETNYTYNNGENNQGIVEQVFHQNNVVTVKTDVPSILTSVTSKDHVKGVINTTTSENHDFYTGVPLHTKSTDSYGNTFVNVSLPAYHIYTSKTSTNAEMGSKAVNQFNRNMLSASAGAFRYKDITTLTSLACTLSTVSTITGNTDKKYKIELSNNKVLPGRYTVNSKVQLSTSDNGLSASPTVYISYIYPDRKSFEFYYSSPNLGGNTTVNVKINAPMSASIQTYNYLTKFRGNNPGVYFYYNTTETDVSSKRIWKPLSPFAWNSPHLEADGSYKSTGTGAYQEFDWVAQSETASWQKLAVPVVKDKFSNTLDVKNTNGNFVSSKIAYNQDYILKNTSNTYNYPDAIYNYYVLATGKNVNSASFGYTGYEELSKTPGGTHYGGEFFGGNPMSTQMLQTSTIKAHTGEYVLKLTASSQGPTFAAMPSATDLEGS